ncbi:APC family permease [Shewanella sp. NIFS-20-20]|uniref:APC family permease n=1 Tax=Shewanella sp. NIFS-20-20 TaxID=2853806 RepID=UPI001C48764B|nr:APC family permease [Shewanella sp. NIFS-20-20]MBV7314561.1 APC family permease [Shewanella sp. NIFS-20-20]
MPSNKQLGVFSVAALGIGSMIGAGVFALLGQISVAVGPETYVVFIISGIAAILSGYSYARLSAHYPSKGGVNYYFRIGLPSERLANALAILFFVTLILTIAMVAKAFGAYGARIMHESQTGMWTNIYASACIIILTILNIIGPKAVGRVEVWLVAVKLGILAIFVVAGSIQLQPEKLVIHHSAPFESILASMGLAFFAYSGYGMMANAAEDVKNPEKTMPRAFMLAIILVMVVYVLLALVVLGNVTPAELLKYSDTAVAQAAEPILGHAGFIMVIMAALIATASSVIANIFALFNVSDDLVEQRLLPKFFQKSHGSLSVGMYLVLGVTLVLTNFVDLASLAYVASATFLLCYLAVFVCAWRLRQILHANALLLAVGFVLMLIIMVMFVFNLVSTSQNSALIILVLSLLVSGWLGGLRHNHE